MFVGENVPPALHKMFPGSAGEPSCILIVKLEGLLLAEPMWLMTCRFLLPPGLSRTIPISRADPHAAHPVAVPLAVNPLNWTVIDETVAPAGIWPAPLPVGTHSVAG